MSHASPSGPCGVDLAREIFPRGLCRVKGAVGPGLDGLLLAAFSARQLAGRGERNAACVDLGSGTGGALLALALDLPEMTGLGLEAQPELVEAARENARRLGLGHRLRFACEDIANVKPARHDAVMANPPYGEKGDGRPAACALRERAMRACGNPLDIFCRAAAMLLRHHGQFFCIYRASRLPDLLLWLGKNSLGARLALPVAPFADSPASRVLLLALRDAAHDLRLLPPLILHEGARGDAPAVRWTRQAMGFCPRVACGHASQATHGRQGDLTFSKRPGDCASSLLAK